MEMKTISAELRLRRALLANLPAVRKRNLEPAQQSLVFREDQSPVKWTGPNKLFRISDKQVYINSNGTEVQHSIYKVKSYLEYHPDATMEARSVLRPFKNEMKTVSVQIREAMHPRDPR